MLFSVDSAIGVLSGDNPFIGDYDNFGGDDDAFIVSMMRMMVSLEEEEEECCQVGYSQTMSVTSSGVNLFTLRDHLPVGPEECGYTSLPVLLLNHSLNSFHLPAYLAFWPPLASLFFPANLMTYFRGCNLSLRLLILLLFCIFIYRTFFFFA